MSHLAAGTRFAEVAVNAHFPHRDTYTYAVPEGLDVRAGHAVYVPFGRRRLQGVVLDLGDAPRFDPERIVPIEGLIEPEPLLSPEQVALVRWLVEEYLAPPFPCARMFLPPGFEERPLTFYAALPLEMRRGGISERHQAVWNYLKENGPIEAAAAKAALREATPAVLDSLVRKGLAIRTFGLAPARGKVRSVPHVRLIADRARVDAWLAHPRGEKPSRKAALLELLAEQGGIDAAAARSSFGEALLRELAERHIVSIDAAARVTLSVTAGQAFDLAQDLRLTAGQKAQAVVLRLLLDEGPVLPRAVVRARTGINMPALRELETEGLIVLEDVPVERDPLAGRTFESRPAPTLTRGQADALRPIIAALERREPKRFLLHGVTGSGKTEVYLAALERALAVGRRGIVLVPEIALTPQMIRRFAERFPGRFTVLHSGLSPGQRFDQWWRVARGEVDIVIGARQALFAPIRDLGIIILDEEHEWTYKQHDAVPRYHARDAALQLGNLTGAVVLLGSATPDVVSYHRAKEGAYRLLTLPERIAAHEHERDGGTSGSRALPDVEVVDMREELRAGNREAFSRALHTAIEETLARGEQIILFLNRRGSSSFLLCRDCGEAPQCSSCSMALSHHESPPRLVCHQCGRSRSVPERCPKCGGVRLRGVGIGTQRLEELVSLTFPRARILRWDRDVTRVQGAHERILGQFLERQADILIGTQ
ncbi:MAG TPA: primosomal protein N', partial [Dehalococcoidia bacterium]|nr:primosomal protein N' [Dehalococcoidia bacterium]